MPLHDCKIVKDQCSFAEYHRQDAQRGDPNYSMSRSELVEFALCPARWRDGFELEEDSTPAMDWGSLIDCRLTSPQRFKELFAVHPETFTNKKGEQSKWKNDRRIAEVAQFLDENEGAIILSEEQLKEADIAVAAIQENPFVAELLKVSRKQVFVLGFWNDKVMGIDIPVRGLLDLVPPSNHGQFGKWLSDFKTAKNGNPETWARVASDNGYDVQGALHLDLYTAATKEDRTDFVWCVQENIKPYHVVTPLPAMSAEFLAWGRMKYQQALTLYARCLKTGKWPSYATAGTVFGGLQIIGPEEVWAWKKTAGQSTLSRNDEPPPTPVVDPYTETDMIL